MKHLKYIALILFVWLGAACEQLPLPNTELTIKSEIVTEVTANSAVIEVEFNPTAATIQNVYACYTSTEKTVMEKVADLTYRVNLLALDNNTEYHVHYMVTNSFSSVTLQNNLSFTTAVNKPSNVIDTVYHIDFTQTMGAWTIKNYLLSGELTSVWFRSDKYGMKASAFLGTNHASEAWLISSPLDLTSNTTAFLTFNQAYKYGDISQIAVKITTNGLDWTTLEVPVWPDGTSWSVINSGEIDITKYISATTQIAFAYTSSAEASPTWEIRDVLIKGNGTRIEEKPTSPYFSVSQTKYITFSPGNLQYTQSTNTWSFAENQWDMIGTDNVTGGSVSSDPTYGDTKSGTGLADKVDLFGWSTSSTNFGVSTSTSNSDYSGSFVDWGTNTIGNDAPNTWRTLTYDEWKYLLNTRPNASSLKGVAQVNGVNGLIFLPDNWVCPSGVTFKSGFHSSNGVDYYAAYQTFTAEQWSKLEAAGAVFLPVAGYRDASNVRYVQRCGDYWSATETDSLYASYLYFYSDEAHMYNYSRYHGRSVRLVKDL